MDYDVEGPMATSDDKDRARCVSTTSHAEMPDVVQASQFVDSDDDTLPLSQASSITGVAAMFDRSTLYLGE